jgi:hypothetical protein
MRDERTAELDLRRLNRRFARLSRQLEWSRRLRRFRWWLCLAAVVSGGAGVGYLVQPMLSP